MAHMIKRSEWTDDIIGKTSDRSFIKAGAIEFLKPLKKLLKMQFQKGIILKTFKC